MTAKKSKVPQFVAAIMGVVVFVAGMPSPGFAEQESGNVQASRPWSIEDALPRNSSALRMRAPEVPTATTPDLGRVPLKTGPGSFGFTAETKIKPFHYPDGRPVPGSEDTLGVRTRKPSSFLGLSVSVPTFD